jgi:hypothetical protein
MSDSYANAAKTGKGMPSPMPLRRTTNTNKKINCRICSRLIDINKYKKHVFDKHPAHENSYLIICKKCNFILYIPIGINENDAINQHNIQRHPPKKEQPNDTYTIANFLDDTKDIIFDDNSNNIIDDSKVIIFD